VQDKWPLVMRGLPLHKNTAILQVLPNSGADKVLCFLKCCLKIFFLKLFVKKQKINVQYIDMFQAAGA